MTDFHLSSVHQSSVYLWLSSHLTNQTDQVYLQQTSRQKERQTANIYIQPVISEIYVAR